MGCATSGPRPHARASRAGYAFTANQREPRPETRAARPYNRARRELQSVVALADARCRRHLPAARFDLERRLDRCRNRRRARIGADRRRAWRVGRHPARDAQRLRLASGRRLCRGRPDRRPALSKRGRAVSVAAAGSTGARGGRRQGAALREGLHVLQRAREGRETPRAIGGFRRVVGQHRVVV